jgi:hypothetical protein
VVLCDLFTFIINFRSNIFAAPYHTNHQTVCACFLRIVHDEFVVCRELALVFDVDGIAAQKSVSIPVQGNVVLQRPTRYEPVK